jgi:hypothetical protein
MRIPSDRGGKKQSFPFVLGGIIALAFLVAAPRSAEAQSSNVFSIHGWLQEGLSFNTQNIVETPQNDTGDLSMARSTLYLETHVNYDWFHFTAIGRANWEDMTPYLKRLERMSGYDLQKYYRNYDAREYYFDFFMGDNVHLRLGKQQVVWGQTDFFHAMDIVEGYDYTWRSFLEPENEQLRKPLILANLEITVPKLNGMLQLIYRPGWDRTEDIGNSYDLVGGRWANQPNKGFNFLQPNVVPFDYYAHDANINHPSYGFRWAGRVRGFQYSVAYYHTLNLDPVVNSIFNPFEGNIPTNNFAAFIFPKVDIYGASFSNYISPLDIVLRGEFAYTSGQPFNVGSWFLGGALPGFDGITRKNTLRSMIGFDRDSVRWATKVLGADRPGFFTFQLFDTWITDFKKSDNLVDLAGYGGPKREHDPIATAVLSWNYNNDKVTPTIAAGWDIGYGGGFLIPSVELSTGNHWRLRLEYDFFWNSASKMPGELEDHTHLFGYLNHNNQLYARVTYQF